MHPVFAMELARQYAQDRILDGGGPRRHRRDRRQHRAWRVVIGERLVATGTRLMRAA
jgi:hypothetical protein